VPSKKVLDKMSKPKISRNEQLLAFICAIFLVTFLFITFFRGSFHSFDGEINSWIPSIQTSPLTDINLGFAVAFDTTSLVIFSMVIAGYLFLKKCRAEGLFLLGAMGGNALIVSIVKNLVESPRPSNGLFFSSGFSFPSGHTAGSIVFCGFIAFFALQHWKNARARASIGTGAFVVSSAVGFSRVYLNVHWFSDVIGAGMLGVFWLTGAVLVFKLLQDWGKFESEGFCRVSLALFVLAIVISVSVIVGTLIFGL
jgi:undecaprenyl-diphosphatase